MSIIGEYNKETGEHKPLVLTYTKNKAGEQVISDQQSQYQPSTEERQMRSKIVKDFQKADIIMRKPRREFNDLSVITRMVVDQMAFNTYQPNNGDALEGDEINSWKSNAIRPIVRNKAISIAAHATASLIFPKIFAYDSSNNEQSEAAQVMGDLMEWAGEQSNYLKTNLYAVIAALVNPASIIFTEYAEVFKKVKKERGDKGWTFDMLLDEDQSGFKDTVVPVDELYISNFYEHDIQKQDFLIWRKVLSYDTITSKYFQSKNFKYVKPGVQVIYDDANRMFYEVYDANMRQDMCEEIIYWNKGLDLKVVLVNGIFMSEHDDCNPRQDKQYPFLKFGYELIDEGKCFYYKSLAFKMMQDANIINTLYPMIIDGTYLSLMPPMVARGGETIGSDVVIPGAVTTLSDPNAKLEPIQVSQNMTAGMNTLMKVEESLNEDSATDQQYNAKDTAYAIAVKQKEAAVVLGLFVQMIMGYVKDFGKLRLGDIIQYLTIEEADKISGELVYKTFLLEDKGNQGKTKKIKFDATLPQGKVSDEEYLALSHQAYQEQGNGKTELFKVNPVLFRKLKYLVKVTPQLVTPMSEEAERAFMLEEYDRAIANPALDQEQVTKDFLLGAYPKSKKDPDKYILKQSQMQPQNPIDLMNKPPMNPMNQMPQPKANVLNNILKKPQV